MAAGLQEAYGMEEKEIAFETISSTVSSEMRRDAVVAVLIAAVCMLIYIWIRFRISDLPAAPYLPCFTMCW